MWRSKEKALELAGERSRAFGIHIFGKRNAMNTSERFKGSQQETVSRRGFLSKAGAAALAAGAVVAAAAVPQVAIAAPSRVVTKVVELDMDGEVGKELANLCKLTVMLGEFVRVNLEVIQAKCPELELELTDFVDDMSVSAEYVSKAGGFRVNPRYVAQYGALLMSMREAA
jgi:hypothetical protein